MDSPIGGNTIQIKPIQAEIQRHELGARGRINVEKGTKVRPRGKKRTASPVSKRE